VQGEGQGHGRQSRSFPNDCGHLQFASHAKPAKSGPANYLLDLADAKVGSRIAECIDALDEKIDVSKALLARGSEGEEKAMKKLLRILAAALVAVPTLALAGDVLDTLGLERRDVEHSLMTLLAHGEV
jgi:hypothetical protein